MIAETDILQDIRSLTPMPGSIVRLSALVASPDSSLEDMAAVVAYDVILTAEVLRWANSAAWAGNRAVTDIRTAFIRLGGARILSLAVGRQVKPQIDVSFEPYGLAEKELWRHSLAAAVAAEAFQEQLTADIPTEAFTAALLHDIGKVVLHRYLDEPQCIALRDLCIQEQLTHWEAERAVLGTDHAEVGGRIAEKWRFPASLVTAIRLHHDDSLDPSPLHDTVHLSNIVAKMIGIGLGQEALNLRADAAAAERLGLTHEALEGICAHVATRLPDIEQLYS